MNSSEKVSIYEHTIIVFTQKSKKSISANRKILMNSFYQSETLSIDNLDCKILKYSKYDNSITSISSIKDLSVINPKFTNSISEFMSLIRHSMSAINETSQTYRQLTAKEISDIRVKNNNNKLA